MSFAMAFFSIAMLLNVSGVHVSDFRASELRPATFVRAYEQTTGKLVRYYENIRIVYEIQSRVQELRESTTEPESSSPDNKVEPSRPTGGLERSGGSYAEAAWMQQLPPEPFSIKGAAARAHNSTPGASEPTSSDSAARSTL
jgi:hypothetical protein